MADLRKTVGRIPMIGTIARAGRAVVRRARFPGSQDYWERRYAAGDTSGEGSYGEQATFKAEVLNRIVRERGIRSVLELGCGDGNQLSLAKYPSYLGLDVAPSAVERCRDRFAGDESKRFEVLDPARFTGADRCHADAVISLEVIFHLVEDEVFETYMGQLFDAADRFVVIFSNDDDENRALEAPHYRNRRFTDWIAAERADWALVERVPNRHPYDPGTGQGSPAEFFVYQRPEG